ncbi:hypothetical protein Ancab_028373 [Ancistrocladus abbreviatus]
MDIWLWICDLPNSPEWDESNSPLIYELMSSNHNIKTQSSIQLKVERTLDINTDTSLTFSLCAQGCRPYSANKTLWVSDACPLSSDKPFLPFVLQLIQEIINHSPIGSHSSTCPRSQLKQLKPDPIAWILETHTPKSFSDIFNVIFLTRLFWLCAYDAPTEFGSLYFDSLLAPHLEQLLSSDNHLPVLRTFLLAVGVNVELCIARSVGYILAKWLILREMRVGLLSLTPFPSNLGISYAVETHGLWVLKGYVPVQSMKSMSSNGRGDGFPFLKAKQAALRYALAHQQLEAVIQLGYFVGFHDGYIQVSAHVDNLRFHVVQLGFNKNGDVMEYDKEIYFPSRVQVWIGPDSRSNYVVSLSLGTSSSIIEKHVEIQRVVKGRLGKLMSPKIKAMTKTTTRMNMKNWRWDQDAEGNLVIYDAILCDNITGLEVYAMKGHGSRSSDGRLDKIRDGFRKQYVGADRPFMKSGGVVFAGDREQGEDVKWRLNKEMEGSVLRWRIGGKVWTSYWPNNVESSYYDTRCIEWCDEVDLPLIPSSK